MKMLNFYKMTLRSQKKISLNI